MSRGWSYASGEWNLLCDVCAKKIKSSEALHRWDGLIVCKDDFEPRHSLDFVRTKHDKIAVPYSRPNDDMSQYVYCSIFQSVGIAGQGAAGCAVAGRSSVHG